MTDVRALTEAVSAAGGQRLTQAVLEPLSGGCINRAFLLADGARRYFVKINSADRVDMFRAEAEGLKALLDANAVRVPRPICVGVAGREAYLVLEYLPLVSAKGDASRARLGSRLATLHRVTCSTFGWHRDNTIGSTPQPNRMTSDWVEFFRTQRLSYQLELAQRYGPKLVDRGRRLVEELHVFFRAYRPAPSLLHGDLWSGNYGVLADGEPVIFDPAVYYGDREADIAMTELFGGFGSRFYASYDDAWPLDAGYAVRKDLYNLYHVLNHLNLFGGSYLSQAMHLIDQLLSEAH